MTEKQKVTFPELDMVVYHEDVYDGKEPLIIVGIRKNELELEGDYSGGTHSVVQKCWLPLDKVFVYRKVCEQIEKFGTCQLHNLHCSYPDCAPIVSYESK